MEPKARLLAAAETQFRRFGYRRTTVDEITRAAGTGKGSFYLHFTSKEAAYLAIVEASLETFLAKAAEALHGEGTVPDRMRALVATTAEHYGHDDMLRASLFGDADTLVDGPVALRAAEVQRARARELLCEVLEQGIEEGSVRDSVDPRATAAILFEIGWAVVRAELEGTASLPLDEALETLNELVGLGLLPRTPASSSGAAQRGHSS